MQSRMRNPAIVIPDAMQALLALARALKEKGLPRRTINLVYIRASQINGCSFCVDMHARDAKREGDTDERLFAVGAWRDSPYFSDAERAALGLAEAATRLSDREDPIPDAVYDEAARHYDEEALSALLLSIALVNAWNRLKAVLERQDEKSEWNVASVI